MAIFHISGSDAPEPLRPIVSGQNPTHFFKRSLLLHPLVGLIGTVALFLFGCSVLRHEAFRSTAFDLAIFDQAVYLISQGQTPFVTVRNLHILGDHAALILYPIALLYRIYPHVYWLFAVQAVGLALGAWPAWGLSRQAGLSQRWAWTVVAAYLLYPEVFGINLFDFHPDVLAPFALLSAVWAARSRRMGWFVAAILLALSLKAVIALVIVGLGVWLWRFEQRQRYGLIAIVTGSVWFLIASRWIIPTFSGAEPAAVSYFTYLGNSLPEIALNLVLRPNLVFSRLFRLQNGVYLVELVGPLLWGLSLRSLSPLVATLPIFAIILLSEGGELHSLVYQYSLPIVPFLILAVIHTLAQRQEFFQKQRQFGRVWSYLAIVWSLVGFIWLANYEKIPLYATRALGGQSTRAAIAHLPPEARVLADRYTTSHVCHRSEVWAVNSKNFDADLAKSNYVLIDLDHAIGRDAGYVKALIPRMQQDPAFQISYQQGQAYLFKRIASLK